VSDLGLPIGHLNKGKWGKKEKLIKKNFAPPQSFANRGKTRKEGGRSRGKRGGGSSREQTGTRAIGGVQEIKTLGEKERGEKKKTTKSSYPEYKIPPRSPQRSKRDKQQGPLVTKRKLRLTPKVTSVWGSKRLT